MQEHIVELGLVHGKAPSTSGIKDVVKIFADADFHCLDDATIQFDVVIVRHVASHGSVSKVLPTTHTLTAVELKIRSVVCTRVQEGCSICYPDAMIPMVHVLKN